MNSVYKSCVHLCRGRNRKSKSAKNSFKLLSLLCNRKKCETLQGVINFAFPIDKWFQSAMLMALHLFLTSKCSTTYFRTFVFFLCKKSWKIHLPAVWVTWKCPKVNQISISSGPHLKFELFHVLFHTKSISS